MNIEIKARGKYVIVNYDGEYFWCWSSYRTLMGDKLKEYFNFNPNHPIAVFNSYKDAEKVLNEMSSKTMWQRL